MRIFQLGYPGNMGGANTECWHTVKLWREAGWDVTLIPTWQPDESYRPKLDAIGVETVVVERVDWGRDGSKCAVPRPRLDQVPGLPGSVVVGMCNSHVGGCWDELRAIGCKIVWVNCMTFLQEFERRAWVDHGPADAYLFQSEFQRERLESKLRMYGYQPEQGFVVRGAFDFSEWPYEPMSHSVNGAFYVGRLARPDADKWSSNLWQILGGIPYLERRALCMGWTEQLEQKCGRPPSWAECLPPQAVSPQEFLARCHALLCVNGGAKENWPRVGLEAMASGVPIIAQNKWGWREMIRHGETGVLAENDAEMCYWAAKLANEEKRRLNMAEAARAHVEDLAKPDRLIKGWQEVFDFAAARGEYRKPVMVL